MDDMGQHSTDAVAELAGKPLNRARLAAWAVFLGMAGTSMAFQTYHALHYGQMPWPLACLYGIVPLGISIGVLLFAAVWPSKPARLGAYLVTAGAMYLSATATGMVSAKAAPSHADLLFGGLLDAAALLAVHFIFDGPSAAHAVSKVAKAIAELTERAEAERAARNEAEAVAARKDQETRAAREAEITAARQAHDVAVSALSAKLAEASGTAQREAAARQEMAEELASARIELAALRTGRDTAEAGRQAADGAREEASARAGHQVENLRSQLDAARAAAARLRTVEIERDLARTEAADLRNELELARGAADGAAQAAAEASARADRATRKLAAATGSGRGGNGTRKTSGTSAGKTAPAQPEVPAVDPADLPGNWDALDTEARVLFLVNEKGYSGSRAGLLAGVTDARGRQIARAARDLSGTAPQDVVDTPEA